MTGLMLLNLFAQLGFVAVVQIDMLEDVLQPDQLKELLLFRANVAHEAKYADLGGGRSLARRICSQDNSLHLANSQTGLVSDLYSYSAIGPVLALLAIFCWLSTTLKEVFNVVTFMDAVRSCPVGDITLVTAEAGEEAEESAIAMSQMSLWRKYMLYGLVSMPRMVVACMLLVTGTQYLANTLNLSDLILNAVALAFILDLDELIASAFMPRRPRFLLERLGTLRVTQSPVPGLEQFKVGLQERIWDVLKITFLIIGLVISWLYLLQPLHQRSHLALNILCSGEQDFIYAVNSATGIIEAAPTFHREGPLTLSWQQEGVLRHANITLSLARPLEGLDMDFVSLQQGDPAFLGEDADDTPTMQKLAGGAMLLQRQVNYHARTTPFLKTLSKSRDHFCAVYNLSSVRALCPQTCGCDDPLESAAAAFATVPFGCPKMCTPLRDESPALLHAPCQDFSKQKLIASEYIKRYLTGAFTISLLTPETRRAAVLMYKETVKRKYSSSLSGRNKTAALQQVVDYYASGNWHRDVVKGKYELGLGIPHPRGLEGCAFLASEEVVELAGGSICTPRAELDIF
ncbi:unnamed protein product, partial [Symbiodinium pilosum]